MLSLNPINHTCAGFPCCPFLQHKKRRQLLHPSSALPQPLQQRLPAFASSTDSAVATVLPTAVASRQPSLAVPPHLPLWDVLPIAELASVMTAPLRGRLVTASAHHNKARANGGGGGGAAVSGGLALLPASGCSWQLVWKLALNTGTLEATEHLPGASPLPAGSSHTPSPNGAAVSPKLAPPLSSLHAAAAHWLKGKLSCGRGVHCSLPSGASLHTVCKCAGACVVIALLGCK